MTNIHPTAIVHPNAKVAASAIIGPFCIVGKNVTLDENVELKSHVCVDGYTEIGEGTIIFPFASIGSEPQDLKYRGEQSRLVIGKNNRIREYVTIQPGTAVDRNETRVGNNCLFMVGSHIAHDCIVGNNVILANYAALAGHVTLDDFVIVGGLSGISQFVRVGKHAIIGGMCPVVGDVIPYGNVIGDRASLAGLNIIGLKRRNFEREVIHDLRKVFTILFMEDYDTFDKRLEDIEKEYSSNTTIKDIIDFLKQADRKSICFPKDKKAS